MAADQGRGHQDAVLASPRRASGSFQNVSFPLLGERIDNSSPLPEVSVEVAFSSSTPAPPLLLLFQAHLKVEKLRFIL